MRSFWDDLPNEPSIRTREGLGRYILILEYDSSIVAEKRIYRRTSLVYGSIPVCIDSELVYRPSTVGWEARATYPHALTVYEQFLKFFREMIIVVGRVEMWRTQKPTRSVEQCV
jgi:hypothetical protein